MTIEDLMRQVEETERLISVYRNASQIVVGTQDQIYSRRGLINRTVLTAAEIGDQIVSILERRLDAGRARKTRRRRPWARLMISNPLPRSSIVLPGAGVLSSQQDASSKRTTLPSCRTSASYST
jgi:hypothetical protein